MDHVLYECPPGCDNPVCNYCMGGLGLCTVCGEAEGGLAKECPGPPEPVTIGEVPLEQASKIARRVLSRYREEKGPVPERAEEKLKELAKEFHQNKPYGHWNFDGALYTEMAQFSRQIVKDVLEIVEKHRKDCDWKDFDTDATPWGAYEWACEHIYDAISEQYGITQDTSSTSESGDSVNENDHTTTEGE